jgi:hypothetical protein
MALDNAEFIAELSIVDPPGTDPLNQGDDHIRTTKKAVQQSFPNVDAAVPQTAAQMAQMAIKNEVNVFTQVNTFASTTDFQGKPTITAGTMANRQVTTGIVDYQMQNSLGNNSWIIRRASDANNNDFQLLRRNVDGSTLDTPFSVQFVDGQVDFSGEVHGAQRFQLNNVNFVSSHSGDRGFAFEDSSNGQTEWIMQARGTSKAWRLQRFSGGVSADTPMSCDFATGVVNFANRIICQNIDIDSTTTRALRYLTSGDRDWELTKNSASLVLAFHRYNNDVFQDVVFSMNNVNGNISMPSLPTTNPGGSGILWKSSGFVAIT